MSRSSIPLVVFALALPLFAQESSFVAPEVHRLLGGEISGDIAYDHIRHLTLYHSTTGVSQGYRDKMQWILGEAKKTGLEDLRLIDDLNYGGTAWNAKSAELFVVSPDYRRLASFAEAAVSIADNSRSGNWEGELVDVGSGSTGAEYKDKDVKGKIVLVAGSPYAALSEAVTKRGALGLVCYNPHNAGHPDQVAWTGLPRRPGEPATFAFSLSYRSGTDLKEQLARGKKLVLQAKVDASIEQNMKQWMVEGWIRGKRRGQAIVLTAHGQEEKYSANDDNSGCANLLEIARSLTKLIREGKLPQPERDIRFWWTNEISSEYEYFAMHPEERGQILLDLNQDMVGAKQSLGSRIQHITRTPDSRPSYLNDVIEGVVNLVVRTNSAYLAASQAGTPAPYSKPILSHFGTRERFGAEIVPYFSNTDHMVFVNSIIGVPAVTLTNWPDDYIHSSDDDLWNVDPTQLHRNAFIVAASAWYFASLAPSGAPSLAAQVHAGAHRRLGESLARATEMLNLASAADRASAYLDGANLIQQALLRERAALDSVRVFDPAIRIDALQRSLAATGESVKTALAANYRALTGAADVPEQKLSAEEQAMAKKVPEVALSVADYIRKPGPERGSGLHGLMAFETMNFVDGRRSYLEIYRAVRAEAQSVGAWYYGKVEAKSVAETLDSAVKQGVLKLK